jgi:hypothetical protein
MSIILGDDGEVTCQCVLILELAYLCKS